MALVRSKDTGPELAVRRQLHALGYRFRLHCRDLPGTPDIVLPKYRSVVLVHGCFWHGHSCKRGRRKPKANRDYWEAKIARNVARDRRNAVELDRLGWRVVTIWECELTFGEAFSVFLEERLEL